MDVRSITLFALLAGASLTFVVSASPAIGEKQSSRKALPAVPKQLTQSARESEKPKPPSPLPPNSDAIQVTAEQLTRAFYLVDQAKVDQWQKKSLLVEGTVWATSRKGDFLPYVVLTGCARRTFDTDKQYVWLICLFDQSARAAINNLKEGQTVYIHGVRPQVISSYQMTLRGEGVIPGK
jgi:hypothetical protein